MRVTFEDWWKQPVQDSKVSKDQMARDVKFAVYSELGQHFDLKVAMKDAWDARYETLTYMDT